MVSATIAAIGSGVVTIAGFALPAAAVFAVVAVAAAGTFAAARMLLAWIAKKRNAALNRLRAARTNLSNGAGNTISDYERDRLLEATEPFERRKGTVGSTARAIRASFAGITTTDYSAADRNTAVAKADGLISTIDPGGANGA